MARDHDNHRHTQRRVATAASPDRHGRGRRLIPPVGYPLERGEVMQGVRGIVTEPRSRRWARRALADYVGVRRAWLFSSGRAGMAIALQALAVGEPERDEVVVPAFTCYSVAGSIVRAGLTVRLVDYAGSGFEIDPKALRAACGPRTLALVAPHLLGYPMDLRPFQQAAKASGARLIDDAAQALGARRRGQACGAGGDLGLLSFGRGKPVTTLGGGALLADDPALLDLLEPFAGNLDHPARLASTRAAVQAAIYTQLLRPEVYWLPSRLPFLKIGVTEFDTDFDIRAMPGFKLGLLCSVLRRLDRVNECRRKIAERLMLGLNALDGVRTIPVPDNGYAVFLRFPLLVEDAAVRERLIHALRAAGIGAGRLYPEPLHRVPELAGRSPDHGDGGFPHAERLADCLVTLPTYPHVTPEVVAIMCDVIAATVNGRGGGTPSVAAVAEETPGEQATAGDNGDARGAATNDAAEQGSGTDRAADGTDAAAAPIDTTPSGDRG